MLSDDGLSAISAIMRLIQTVIEQVGHTTALTHKTANREGPRMSNIACFLIDNGLDHLFAALASHIDRVVIYLWVVSEN